MKKLGDKLRLGFKKQTALLLSRFGIGEVSAEDQTYKALLGKLLVERKQISSKVNSFVNFMDHFSNVYKSLVLIVQDIYGIYFCVNEGDYCLPYLKRVTDIIVELQKSVCSKNKELTSNFEKVCHRIRDEMFELGDRGIMQRDEKKLNFDSQNSTVKALTKRASKSKNPQSDLVSKLKREKKKLVRVLNEYTRANVELKYKILMTLQENLNFNSNIMFSIFLEILKLVDLTNKKFQVLLTILGKLQSEKSKRTVYKFTDICCYILEDSPNISTIITDQLFIGNRYGAYDLDELQRKGVETVMNFSFYAEKKKERVENKFKKNFKYINISAANIHEDSFHDFSEVLEMEFQESGAVFLTCYSGITTSAMYLIAYYMKKEKKKLLETFKMLQKRRRFIYPSPEQVDVLVEFESKLFEDSTPRGEDEEEEEEFVALPKPKDIIALREIEIYSDGVSEISQGLELDTPKNEDVLLNDEIIPNLKKNMNDLNAKDRKRKKEDAYDVFDELSSDSEEEEEEKKTSFMEESRDSEVHVSDFSEDEESDDLCISDFSEDEEDIEFEEMDRISEKYETGKTGKKTNEKSNLGKPPKPTKKGTEKATPEKGNPEKKKDESKRKKFTVTLPNQDKRRPFDGNREGSRSGTLRPALKRSAFKRKKKPPPLPNNKRPTISDMMKQKKKKEFKRYKRSVKARKKKAPVMPSSKKPVKSALNKITNKRRSRSSSKVSSIHIQPQKPQSSKSDFLKNEIAFRKPRGKKVKGSPLGKSNGKSQGSSLPKVKSLPKGSLGKGKKKGIKKKGPKKGKPKNSGKQ